MNSFACYCQKCRAANLPSEESCANCGTPLMLIVTPPAARGETLWSDVSSHEHLLERISLLELRVMQITDRLGKALDLIIRQSKNSQKDHFLIETLIEALTTSGVIAGGDFSQIWQEKKKNENQRERFINRLEQMRERILIADKSKSALFRRLVVDGFQLLTNEDEKQGIRTLERAAALKPENYRLLAFIGEHHFHADKRVLARDYLERAHRISSVETRVVLLLGVILADEDEFETAKNLLEPLSVQKSFAANFVLGMIYAAESRLHDALTVFKRALSALPTAETHYLVGSVCFELGREKTAFRYLQKAVEIDPNFADAWFMLGAVCLRSGDEKSAKDALNHSLSVHDSTAQSHAILRNPKKFAEIANTTLIFARLGHVRKNLISGNSPRLLRMLREDIDLNIGETAE